MKSWRRSQWIENKSREYKELANFQKKDDPKGLNTLFVKISTLTCEKRQDLPNFRVLNLKILNSNLIIKLKEENQWIENRSREYKEIANFQKKDDPKGLNTLFVKISILTCEKRQECPIFWC